MPPGGLMPDLSLFSRLFRGVARTACGLIATLVLVGGEVLAQPEKPSTEKLAAPGLFIPQFVDPERRIERRNPNARLMIRFVTEEDYPPFNYLGRDGALAGFNIDLARAICAELAAQCTIQPRQWALLLPAIDRSEADAVIASHRITGDLKRAYEVSLPTHRSPARFVGRQEGGKPGEAATTVQDFAGKTVGIVGGSAHEAYLNAYFPALRLSRFEKLEAGLEAMRRGDLDLVFGDGIAIAFWLNGSESLNCCRFVGGPYTEARYFGEGAGIVMRLGNRDLRNAIDFALWRINRDGRYARLYLKHFPVPIY
jgi:polar amino acid transport system substrate-binding protein